MGVKSWLLAPRAHAGPVTLESAEGWTSLGGVGTASVRASSGETVTPNAAMGLSAYYACVSGISADIAKLPVSVVRRMKPRGREVLDEHAVTRLLDEEPNPEMDAFTFRETMTAWALGWGNGYATKEVDGVGRTIALWPTHPSRVAVVRDDKGEHGPKGGVIYKVRADDLAGRWFVVKPEQMFHLHGLGDGIEGYSVLRFQVESLGRALAVQRFASAFFGNNLAVGSVFTSPPMAKEHFEGYKKSLLEAHAGAHKAGAAMVLNGGGDVKRMTVNPDEAQALETWDATIPDICRWFRRDPMKVGYQGQAKGWATFEAYQTADVTDCLTPWIVRWEKAVKRSLLRDERGLSFKHYVQGLMRGDSAARADYYTKRLQNGSITPNEIRELEDENPADDDGADALWIQGATVPIAKQMKEPVKHAPTGSPIRGGGKVPGGKPTEDDEATESDAAAAARLVSAAIQARILGDSGLRNIAATSTLSSSAAVEPVTLPVVVKIDEAAVGVAVTKASADLRAEFRASLRPVFLAAASRVVSKESKAVGAAMEKERVRNESGRTDGKQFASWCREWYEGQRAAVVAEFAAPVAALNGVEDGEPFARLRNFAASLWPDPIERTGDVSRGNVEGLAATLADAVMAACRPKE